VTAAVPELDSFASQLLAGTARVPGYVCKTWSLNRFLTAMTHIPCIAFDKLMHSPTPQHFLQCHIHHEMEADLRFIMSQVG
jgi:hypothetical protein